MYRPSEPTANEPPEPSDSRKGAAPDEDEVHAIVARGPRGALWLASIATGIVFAIWFIFYFAVFIPRGITY